MKVVVKFFALAREQAGLPELSIDLPTGTTAGGLLEVLCVSYPKLQPYRHHIRMAVNREFADDGRELCEKDEVAVIPPVSGG